MTGYKVDTITGQFRENDSLSEAVNPLGALISVKDSQWNSQSLGGDWTQVGTAASVTFAGNKISFADNSDAALTKYIINNTVKTALKRWTMKAKFKITSAIGASTYGMIFGATSGQDNWSKRSIQWKLRANNGDGNTGKTSLFFQEGLTGYVTSNAVLPLAQNDVIYMTATYNPHVLTIKFENLTQGGSTTLRYRFDSNSTYPPLNCCNFGFNAVGGTHEMTEFEVSSPELKNLDLLFVGDSITNGAHADATGRCFVDIVADRFPSYRMSRFSGGSDGAFHYAQSTVLNSITALKPKNAFMLLGTNDLGFSRTLNQLKADYGTIVTALKAAGTNVIHGGLLPREVLDVRAFNSWLKTNYPNDVIIDLFSPLADTGVNVLSGGAYTMSATYAADAPRLHPNNAGHLLMADVITSELISQGFMIPMNPSSRSV